MKLYRSLTLLGVGAAAAITVAVGCSSSDDSAAPTAAGAQPPGPPSGAANADTSKTETFALNAVQLGDTTRAGATSTTAWKDYGYNIDGLITSKTDTNVCNRAPNTDSSKQEDGTNGIDNAFGKTILAALVATGLVPAPSATLDDSISSGKFTIILSINGLTDDPKQSAVGLTGKLLVGGLYNADANIKPTFLPTDDWPYRAKPQVDIQGAYINNGTFVNGSGGAQVQLALLIQNTTLNLTINKAIITFDHTGPNDITNGTISGVVDTETLITGIDQVAGSLSTSLCSGDLLKTVETTIRSAADIRSDGSNGPGQDCNAISIGIGFTGKRIGDPKTVAPDPAPAPDPCTVTDAGTDASQSDDASTDAGADAADAADSSQ